MMGDIYQIFVTLIHRVPFQVVDVNLTSDGLVEIRKGAELEFSYEVSIFILLFLLLC